MMNQESKLIPVCADIKWKEKKRFCSAIEDKKAENVIVWVYLACCSPQQWVLKSCEDVLSDKLTKTAIGSNSCHGMLYSYHEGLRVENLAEIREEWCYDFYAFLPITELIKVINSFVPLFKEQAPGKIEFSVYDVPPSFRLDADEFDSSGNKIM